MSDTRDRAVRLLSHYISTAFEKAGAKWHSDNEVEIADLVDAIIEATEDTIKARAEGR